MKPETTVSWHILSTSLGLAVKVLTAVLQAASKAQLKAGIPLQGHPACYQTFDLDHFDRHENRPQIEYADINQGLREGRTDITSG